MGSLFTSLHNTIMKTDPLGSKGMTALTGSDDPLNLTTNKEDAQNKELAAIEAENAKKRSTQYGIVSPQTKTIGTVNG